MSGSENPTSNVAAGGIAQSPVATTTPTDGAGSITSTTSSKPITTSSIRSGPSSPTTIVASAAFTTALSLSATPSVSIPLSSSNSIFGLPLVPNTLASTTSIAGNSSATGATGGTDAIKATKNRPFSSGAAAGFSVGFLILGALLAVAAIFLFRGFRSKRQRQRGAVSFNDHEAKGASGVGLLEKRGATATWDDYLPQPKEDKAIISEFSKLKSRIEGHIQTYYTAQPANPAGATQALLGTLGAGSPLSHANLPASLTDPLARAAVLKAAIAWVVLSRLSTTGNVNNSYLPPHVAGLYTSMARDGSSSEAHPGLLAKWRQTTAMLSTHVSAEQASGTGNPQTADAVNQTLRTADGFLVLFADPKHNDARLQHLKEIIKRAARFDLLLFSQPSEFMLDWSVPTSACVIFPALSQTTSEYGQRLAVPRVLYGAETANI